MRSLYMINSRTVKISRGENPVRFVPKRRSHQPEMLSLGRVKERYFLPTAWKGGNGSGGSEFGRGSFVGPRSRARLGAESRSGLGSSSGSGGGCRDAGEPLG
jgi:hypothetical protein